MGFTVQSWLLFVSTVFNYPCPCDPRFSAIYVGVFFFKCMVTAFTSSFFIMGEKNYMFKIAE